MTSTTELGHEQRIAAVERALASMQATLDSRVGTRASHGHADRRSASHPRTAKAGVAATSPPKASSAIDFDIAAFVSRRSAEWWLGALGVLFLVIAVFLLYRYAVDHNWITPFVRILTGVVIGGGLIGTATRYAPREADRRDDGVGLREILLSGGIAVWYITAYAAAIFYQLVSIPMARFCFFTLSVAAGWLALLERRLLYALISVGVGFAIPSILPWPSQSAISVSFYLGVLGALGMVLYLMRGWQSVMWITFVGFWWNAASISGPPNSRTFSFTTVAVMLVVVLAGAAFTRVPTMRRRLVALGSERYAGVPTPDTPALWILTLTSAMLMLGCLATLLPDVASELWGALAFAFGVEAYRLSAGSAEKDSEVAHVERTAAFLWTLVGLFGILWGVADRAHWEPGPLLLAATVLHAAVAYRMMAQREFPVPLALTKIAVFIALCISAISELDGRPWNSGHLNWTIAEVAVLCIAAWFWRTLSRVPDTASEGAGLGVIAYGVLLIVLTRVLGSIWLPLVTVSFALAGATLLVLSRSDSEERGLRRLGGVTMLLVVVRLVVIDMSTVETIWRVLLFLGCGLMFLYTSHRLQPVAQPANE